MAKIVIDVCVISCYFKGVKPPRYLKKYIEELSLYCSEIIFVTTNKPLLKLFNKSFIKRNKIQLFFVENEGFDFGMWYKALKNIDEISNKTILLTNDSCVLINPLEPFFTWVENEKSDYLGLLSSGERNYHYQSYFHVFRGQAINCLMAKFKQEGLKTNYQEVVNDYELKLLEYFKNQEVTSGVMYDEGNFTKLNPIFFSLETLINKNFPLVKRQLIFGFSRPGNLGYLKSLNFNLENSRDLIKNKSVYGNEYIQ